MRLLIQCGIRHPLGLALAFATLACCLCGCGVEGSSINNASPVGASTPVAGQSTKVTVLLSSTANDLLANFQMSLGTLTLTDENGKKVTVFSLAPQELAESIHPNSVLEPLATANIPQGLYTAASLTFSNPQYTFVTYASGHIYFNTALDFTGNTPQPATVNVHSPISISGSAMALVLDSRVSQSVTMSGNPQSGNFSTSITPIFTIAAKTIASEQNTSLNMESGIFGRVTSVDSTSAGVSGLILTTSAGAALAIAISDATVYQGLVGASVLEVGMFADVDTSIQNDGTLIASRVEAMDPTAHDLVTGPIFNVDAQMGIFNLVGEREQGSDFSPAFRSGGMALKFTGDTEFQIFGGFEDPQNLPFTPTFDASNLATGQNLAVTATSIPASGPVPVIDTATLIPQTVDGTVRSTSSSGEYKIFNLGLASYDPLNPQGKVATIEVYVGANTQMLNSVQAVVGSLLRFHGLVFNDDGTLRMVCSEVDDGVNE